MKKNAPNIYESLNDGADVTNLSRYLKERGCTARGHLAFWTEINGQNTSLMLRYDHGFFGGFQFYHNKGYMYLLSLQAIFDCIKFELIPSRMCHCIGYGGRSNRHTVELLAVLMNDGSLKKIRSASTPMPYPQGGGSFVGFMEWYRDALYKN